MTNDELFARAETALDEAALRLVIIRAGGEVNKNLVAAASHAETASCALSTLAQRALGEPEARVAP